MAHTIYIGAFSKHDNSTAQPTITDWASFDVVFKEGADLTAPQITIAADLSTLAGFNYCKMLNRYYWIRRMNALRAGYTVLDLEVDVLATYKTEIGASPLYILRASAASDGAIRDNYYPMTADKTTSAEILETDNILLGSGSYIVNILGSNTGSSTLYCMAPSAFSSLLSALIAEAGTIAGLDFSQAAVNAIFSPMDYIKSVIWLPLSPAEVNAAFGISSAGTVVAGMWDSHISGSVLNTGAALLRTHSVTLPKHPKAATRGKYLNAGPYTEYIIDYDPFGVFQLDTSRLVDDTTLTINIYVDAITGIGILKAGGNNSGPIASINAQFGVPIPLAGAASNFGAISSVLGAIGGFVAGSVTANPGMMAGALAAGIGNFGEAARGVVGTTGGAGSMAAYQTGKTFGAIFYDIVDEDNTHNGRPYCQVTTPANLTGYMIAQHGDVEIAAPLPELDMIRGFLESGFYYE